jgi:AraC-like DNA-binding protein
MPPIINLTGHPALPHAAELAGFGFEESLRRQFRRIALASPGAYRKKLGAPARVQTGAPAKGQTIR